MVGVEVEKTVPSEAAAGYLGAAAWVGREGESATFMWPHLFSDIADEYDRRYGLDDTHLRAIAALNLANTRRNPNAQTRGWTVPDLADTDDATNPVVEGRLRRFDCSQVTDGGAGVMLVSDAWRRDNPSAAVASLARITGWGHRTVGLGLRQKLERDTDDPYVLPHVRAAVADAWRRARVELDDLDGLETHDCFTPSEYLAIDHIGLTGPARLAVHQPTFWRRARLRILPTGLRGSSSRISSRSGSAPAAWAVNLITHRSNARLADDLRLVAEYRPPGVITALGSPRPVMDVVKGHGGLVIADVVDLALSRTA